MRQSRFLLAVLLCVFFWSARLLSAQVVSPSTPASGLPPATFSLENGPVPMTSIEGLWRFQPGDDPRFADPAYDDSQWKLLKSTTTWTSQGYKQLSGFAWYRFKVVLPPGKEPMALLLPPIYTAYQCYAGGKLLQTVGALPKHGEALPWRTISPNASVILLPQNTRPAVQIVVVALRVWQTSRPGLAYGGPILWKLGLQTGMQVGTAAAIRHWFHNQLAVARYLSLSLLEVSAVQLLAALIGFGLYLLRRSDREYFWFFISYALSAANGALGYEGARLQLNWLFERSTNYLLLAFSWLAYLLFYKYLLKAEPGRLLKVSIAGVGLFYLFALLAGALVLFPTWVYGFQDVPLYFAYVWIILLLVRRSAAGMVDARILLGAEALNVGASLYESLRQMASWTFDYNLHFSIYHTLFQTPFPVSLDFIFQLLYVLALLGVIFYRFARSQREHDRIQAEVEAARTLQHVLIPEALPAYLV